MTNRVFLDEVRRIQERIEQLVEQAVVGSTYDPAGADLPGSWSPAIDMVETEEAFLLTVDLPGVAREDVRLAVVDGGLELSGERFRPAGADSAYLRMERRHGRFSRRLELGAALDGDGVEAKLRRGVLVIRAPKATAGAVSIPIEQREV